MDTLKTVSPGMAERDGLLTVLKPLLKWWWLLALCMVLAVASSAFYTLQRPPIYQSTATLMVGTALLDPNPSSGEFGLATQLAAAYANMARRSSLYDATKHALGMEWLPEYSVRHLANTQFLEISVLDSSPERAQIVAQELANQLLQRSPVTGAEQDRQHFIDEQLDQLERGIIETKQEIERLELELAQLFSARQIADARAQLDALQTKLATLQANYATLLANSRRQATNILLVVEPASLPQYPLDSEMTRNVAIAGLLGVMMAAVAAYWLEFTDDTLRTRQDVQRWFGIPTLGATPKQRDDAGTLAAWPPSQTTLSDAFAALRLTLQTLVRQHGAHTLLLTSPALEEGRPWVAGRLCLALAHAGTRVILIDADLRQPTLHHAFGLPNRVGLTTALTEHEGDVVALCQPTAEPLLWVMTSGPLPTDPASLLAAPETAALLARLRSHADLVVLVAPPLGAAVDPAILAVEVNGVVLVLAARQTTRTLTAQAIKTLAQIDARLLGVILDRAPNADEVGRLPYGRQPRQAKAAHVTHHELVQTHTNGITKPDTLAPSPTGRAGAKRAFLGKV